MKPVLLALFVLFAAAGLAGCGQKGDLYLPGHNPNPPEPLIQPANPDHAQSGPKDNHKNSNNEKRTAPADAADSKGG